MKILGKRGRKTIRSVKREKYSKNFAMRFGMSRAEWVNFKNAARSKGLGYQIDDLSQSAYCKAMGER